MKRTVMTTLALLGLATTSCTMAALDAGLPNVSAAPPSVAVPPAQVVTLRAVTTPPVTVSVAESRAPGVAPLEPRDPDVEKVLDVFRNARTGLAGHELRELAETVVAEAEKHDMDPELVLAVIHVESRGYHRAVSPVGALGLMQIMPRTGEELARQQELDWSGADSLFDPQLNVKLGVAYLRQLADRYNSLPTALAAYNWGPGRIDSRIRRGRTLPSLYISQVMRAYDRSAETPTRALAQTF